MAEYFELSWAILSTIGIFNTLVGVMVVGIVGFSMVSLVPLIVSVAMAVANGLCYYAFYTDHPVANIAAASVSADLFWLVSEPFCIAYIDISLTASHRSRKQVFPSTATPSWCVSSQTSSAASSWSSSGFS